MENDSEVLVDVFDDFVQVDFDVSPIEPEIFANATNQTNNNNEKQEIRKDQNCMKIVLD